MVREVSVVTHCFKMQNKVNQSKVSDSGNKVLSKCHKFYQEKGESETVLIKEHAFSIW